MSIFYTTFLLNCIFTTLFIILKVTFRFSTDIEGYYTFRLDRN